MPPTVVPNPTWLYRLVHVDCLATILARGALHAPHTTPDDGLPYRPIHDVSVQASRHVKQVPCGPGGTIHDYLPFYFGPLSVMLLKLKTGGVAGYAEGQEPLVYLLTAAQRVQQAGYRFVFTEGHGLASFTRWYEDLAQLDQVDWSVVGERYWKDTPDDNDRKRRKQAEFLVQDRLDWALIGEIGVMNDKMKAKVEAILKQHADRHQPDVAVRSDWYYY